MERCKEFILQNKISEYSENYRQCKATFLPWTSLKLKA